MLKLPITRRSAWFLLAFIGVALLLDFLFFTGYYASDDRHYLAGARAITGDGIFVPELGNVRLGITLPCAFIYWVFGTVGAVIWFHVVYHLGLVVLAYVAGRMLHGERTGLGAAALIATSPLIYVHAGAVLPDNANAFWLTASLIAVVAMRRGADEVLSSRRRFVGYFITGVTLGFAYTCKEVTLIMCLPAAVFTMTAGPPLRRLEWIRDGATIILGLVVVLIGDYLALHLVTGQWISRLGMMADHGDEFRESMAQQGSMPWQRFGTVGTQLGTIMPITMCILMVGSVSYGFLRRDRSLGLLVAFWLPLIYLTIGPTRLDEYLPPVIQGRYYTICILPAAVMTAASTFALLDRYRAQWVRRLVLALAILVAVTEVWRALPSAGTLYNANEVRSFVAAMEEVKERYPTYDVVISHKLVRRMQLGLPLRGRRLLPFPFSAAIKPYVYLDRYVDVDKSLLKLNTPTHEAVLVFDTYPPESRGAVLNNAVRHMFNVEPQRQLRTTKGARTAVILVSPRGYIPTGTPKR